MVYVPAGNFSMGTNDGASDEKPMHSVFLDSYWFDKTEVTNGMYALCVSAGACQVPFSTEGPMPKSIYGNLQYKDYPVTYVNWNYAQSYCHWAGARLPTEAEWEKAARGTDGRMYPWGNEVPTCSLANFGFQDCVGDTSAVGTHPSGASPYGALDLAGNVMEWVNDWYDSNYYTNSPFLNPQGPSSGTSRVLRGGFFSSSEIDILSTKRLKVSPTFSYESVGFRCVLGVSPSETQTANTTLISSQEPSITPSTISTPFVTPLPFVTISVENLENEGDSYPNVYLGIDGADIELNPGEIRVLSESLGKHYVFVALQGSGGTINATNRDYTINFSSNGQKYCIDNKSQFFVCK